MGLVSTIEWTNSTWNPLIGCTKYSDGCKNCYADRIAMMMQSQGMRGYENGFKLTLRPERLDIPLHWKKPRWIFVDSMCDLFHEDVPLEYIQKVFAIMHRADWHNYQILTKRAERMRELSAHLDWAPHIWPGVTIESEKYISRLEDLKAIKAKHKWLSLEPLLTRLPRLDLTGIDWVVACGESGRNARPMELDWVREIRDFTHEQGKAFYFKQMSEYGCYGNAPPPLIDGKLYQEFPEFETKEPSLF
ncbi:MAG: phage Gp37/Gp68 family protein [Alphaproteobacteria bacterium]|nr:phage Gp37/Gp68 family protein [Alphaproteobacteria bacterium]